MRVHIDGIPLDLASRLLPWSTRLSFGLLTHLHIHAGLQSKYADAREKPTGRAMSRMAHMGLVDSLMSTVKKLRYEPSGTEWADYYSDTNYTREGLEHKAKLVGEYLDAAGGATVWDFGANTGFFSRIAAERGAGTVAFDIDPAAVERYYLECRSKGERRILPLVVDLANPSPAIGWANAERMSLSERGPADAAMALALVHHLAIGNNVPLRMLARFFAEVSKALVIEFVPKEDSQVRRLLVTREDVFTEYTEESFRREFAAYFDVERSERIKDSLRSLYLMRRKGQR
jgi:ribosomal protein L11 methylase PrmA